MHGMCFLGNKLVIQANKALCWQDTMTNQKE